MVTSDRTDDGTGPRNGTLSTLDEVVGLDADVADGSSGEDVDLTFGQFMTLVDRDCLSSGEQEGGGEDERVHGDASLVLVGRFANWPEYIVCVDSFGHALSKRAWLLCFCVRVGRLIVCSIGLSLRGKRQCREKLSEARGLQRGWCKWCPDDLFRPLQPHFPRIAGSRQTGCCIASSLPRLPHSLCSSRLALPFF